MTIDEPEPRFEPPSPQRENHACDTALNILSLY
jgi:hypothetical protein